MVGLASLNEAVQCTYEAASSRRALTRAPFNSHHQDQAQGTASNPPDPCRPLFNPPLVEGLHSASALGILFPSFDVGSVCTACRASSA
eukprot:1140325-Pelagomonas_calceolata.AAC.9